ncbi:glycosyltransferase [bacterium]|nr:glycosyltransferase [bacterium]
MLASMTKRIRLLVTTSDFVGRGAERELANLLQWLPRDRFDIALCLWRDVFDYPCPADIPITILGKSRPWHVLRVIRRLQKLVREWSPDLVFSQLNYVSTVTGSALKGMGKTPPWIARLAGNPDVEIRFPVLPWTRSSFERATYVAGCSEGASQSIVSHLFVPPERVVTLPNVVDVEWIGKSRDANAPFRSDGGAFVFVHAGRCVPQKNQSMLLDAFALANIPRSELWILGVGPLHERLMAQAKKLGISERVNWVGFQANPYTYFRQADCFVLSSRYEGLPNVVIEAMLCGLPVISTDCPYGPADLIENRETGILTPLHDTGSLAQAMKQMAENRAEAKQMGLVAERRTRERFTPEQIVRQYVDLFERAVGEDRS